MDSTTAINFFAENPRSTAKEAGLTKAEADALVGRGKIIPAGNRKTGKKGRPPVEYVVVGFDLDDDSVAQEAVRAAQDRVRAHRNYERLSNAIMRAANEFGHGSDQHTDAKLYRLEAYSVLPPIPSGNDWVLAGVVVEDAPLPLLPDEEVEA